MAEKLIVDNRRARHDYHLSDKVEAGLVLSGTEVKSLRGGQATLQQAYAEVREGEAWLNGLHIPEYTQGNRANHDPDRPRKLLLHRKEIDRMYGQVRDKGLTVVPTRLYFRDGRVKVELAAPMVHRSASLPNSAPGADLRGRADNASAQEYSDDEQHRTHALQHRGQEARGRVHVLRAQQNPYRAADPADHVHVTAGNLDHWLPVHRGLPFPSSSDSSASTLAAVSMNPRSCWLRRRMSCRASAASSTRSAPLVGSMVRSQRSRTRSGPSSWNSHRSSNRANPGAGDS